MKAACGKRREASSGWTVPVLKEGKLRRNEKNKKGPLLFGGEKRVPRHKNPFF